MRASPVCQCRKRAGRHFYQLGGEFEYVVDPSGQLELEDLLADPDAFDWRPSAADKPSSAAEPVWLRLRLHFPNHQLGKTHYLFAMSENLYEVRIYRPDASGGYRMLRTGNDYPASSRELATPRYGFLITPESAQSDIYLRVVGGPGTNALPWVLMNEGTYNNGHNGDQAFNLVCLTALGTLLLFNASIAVSDRRWSSARAQGFHDPHHTATGQTGSRTGAGGQGQWVLPARGGEL